MIKNRYIIFLSVGCLFALSACSSSRGHDVYGPEQGVARLVILGTVSNTTGEVLPGICVSVDDIRQPQETDMQTYNYAITDTTGHYTIIRYRGRELPTQVTVTASDPTRQYATQTQVVPIRYDYISINSSDKQPYNGYAEADFILSH